MKLWFIAVVTWVGGGTLVSGILLHGEDTQEGLPKSSSESVTTSGDSNVPISTTPASKELPTFMTYLHDPTINKDQEDSSEFYRGGVTMTPLMTMAKTRKPTSVTPTHPPPPPPPPAKPSTFPSKLKPTNPPIPVPDLPSTYEILVEVTDMIHDEKFLMRERERDGRATHTLKSATLNGSCIYNTLNSDGYSVEGVKCKRYSGLPQNCFCTSRFCRPYIAIGALLQYLRERNVAPVLENISNAMGIEIVVWKASNIDMTVEAVYTRTNDGEFTPYSFNVTGLGRIFMLSRGALSLHYQVRSWALDTDPAHVLASTPPGVFCPAPERKFLPKLANQFSITMETVIENLGTVAYESQHYESEEKLVSFTYRPHLHADGMFLLNIPGLTDMTMETYRVIHDFKTGIQYMINEKTSNCSIQGIPIMALDAAPADNQHIRLRHASELISIDPNMFIYKGTRRVRGIISDVWVAEHGLRKGQYSTVEIYFSHENWTIEVEVFNKARQIPIGISSYIADADNPSQWTSVVHTFFYEYSDGHPSWRQFDISPCLNRINRLFLILSLEVSYSELVHYNLEAAKNSIRRAVAGIAGVSPLRVTDLFLSSRQATGEVDVWFVLLEKPDVTGPVMTPRPQLMMADAFKLLHDITHKHNVSVKLDLSAKKKKVPTATLR